MNINSFPLLSTYYKKSSLFLLKLIVLGLFFTFSGCDTRTTIVNSVSEREAIEIIVLLSSKNIAATKIPGPTTAGGAGTAQPLWDVTVPSSQITEALTVLNQYGLPRPKGTSLLDLFGNPGIVPSDLQDRIRYQEGLSEQLAMTIRKMDGVIDADVQITFPREDEEPKKAMTASIYIKHKGILDASNNLLVTKIKRLVSSAIPGLTPDNVTVVTDKVPSHENQLPSCDSQTDVERGWVSIWSIVIAKDSAVRFRVIFYLFIFALFLLASVLTLFIWKFFPLISDLGRKKLLRPEQITRESLQKEVIVEERSDEGPLL